MKTYKTKTGVYVKFVKLSNNTDYVVTLYDSNHDIHESVRCDCYQVALEVFNNLKSIAKQWGTFKW